MKARNAARFYGKINLDSKKWRIRKTISKTRTERGFRWLDIAAIAGLLLLSVVLVLALTLWMVTVAKVYGQSSEDFRNWMLGFATMVPVIFGGGAIGR